ncbi:MAG: OsmC family protein [Candidatus Omnitrophica bacterium]|nr:OsmC family protein [Candidatus Omnitrophota bacterium]
MEVRVKLQFSKGKESQFGQANFLEVLLSALGGCIGVYANKYLERHAIAFTKLEIMVTGELTTESPARIVDIKVKVDTDAQLGDKKEVFLRFIHNCPVHNTLLNTKEVEIDLL